jgi:uncharacterized protein
MAYSTDEFLKRELPIRIGWSPKYHSVLEMVIEQFTLDIDDIHGVHHWKRVLDNGRRLATVTGANIDVVELFSLFHDACRLNDGRDPEHGQRGAELAVSLRSKLRDITDVQFEHLIVACRDHTLGMVDADITVQTCWDADRLDLGRVGIVPSPQLLCTAAARSDVTLRQ